MRARWITIAVTVAPGRRCPAALPLVPRQFFPASDRPGAGGRPAPCRRTPRSTPATRWPAGSMPCSRAIPDVERWSTYVGRGAIRFYLPLDVKLPNDFFSQAVVVAKDVAARDRLQAKLEKVMAEQMPSVVGRVSPLELGPPVGWPVQYRVSGPDPSQVRVDRARARRGGGGDPQTRGGQFRLDGAGPPGARQHRPGPGAAAGPELARRWRGAQHRGGRHAGHAGARRHLSRQRHRAGAPTSSASRSSTLRALQVPLPNGRTVPLSQVATFDFTQEYPADLAARPRSDPDGAGRRARPALLPAAVVAALAPAIEKLGRGLPHGYHIAVGGTVEESASRRPRSSPWCR